MTLNIPPCDTRPLDHTPFNSRNTYGGDQSGDIQYIYNSKGFRGDEYDEASDFIVCGFGDSHLFGTGLDYSNCYFSILKDLYQENTNLKCNFLNFGVGGVALDYAVRQLFIYAPIIKPNLVLLSLPPILRMEYLIDNKIDNLNIQLIANGTNPSYQLEETALAYYDLYNDELGIYWALKNLLLVQEFLLRQNIDFIFVNGFMDLSVVTETSVNYVWKQNLMLDKCVMYDFNQELVDLAADGTHGGPLTHKKIAEKIYKTSIELNALKTTLQNKD